MKRKLFFIIGVIVLFAISDFSYAGVYKVKQGDNLKKIARDYNTTVKDLMVSNKLSTEILQIDQKLIVPDSMQTQQVSSYPVSKSQVPKPALKIVTPPVTKSQALNTAPKVIFQKDTSVKAVFPVKKVTANTIVAKFDTRSLSINRSDTMNYIVFHVPKKVMLSYKIRPGDTLLGIAKHFGASARDIKNANAITNNTILTIGRTLKIPSYVMEEKRLPVEDFAFDTSTDDSDVLGGDSRPFQLIALAKEYQGVPYKWGGESPYRVDCSGFVKMLFKCFDILLPRTSRVQFKAGKDVEKITVGDLLFFATRGSKRINHVGIYIGGGRFIHASSAEGKVVITPLNEYYQSRFRGAKRVWDYYSDPNSDQN